jgi:hypothetical protein
MSTPSLYTSEPKLINLCEAKSTTQIQSTPPDEFGFDVAKKLVKVRTNSITSKVRRELATEGSVLDTSKKLVTVNIDIEIFQH